MMDRKRQKRVKMRRKTYGEAMRNRFVLVFILIGALIACAGLQGTGEPVYTYTDAPRNTLLAAEASGTPAFAMTSTALELTHTAYIASFPTLDAEQGQIIRQTQDVLIAGAYARSTAYYLSQTAILPIMTAYAEAFAEGTNPYTLTVAAQEATRAAYTPDDSVDEFDETAASILHTATARAYHTPSPCPRFAWTEIQFYYRAGLENPEIHESTRIYCSAESNMLFSHQIVIDEYDGFSTEQSYAIIEDAISKLPDYPPHQPEVSEIIYVWVYGKGYLDCGIVTYSNAIAAYEDGLRGEDLAQALGIRC